MTESSYKNLNFLHISIDSFASSGFIYTKISVFEISASTTVLWKVMESFLRFSELKRTFKAASINMFTLTRDKITGEWIKLKKFSENYKTLCLQNAKINKIAYMFVSTGPVKLCWQNIVEQ